MAWDIVRIAAYPTHHTQNGNAKGNKRQQSSSTQLTVNPKQNYSNKKKTENNYKKNYCARNTYRAHFTNFGSLVCCGRCWLSLYNAHRLRLDLDTPYGHLLLVVVVVPLLAANEELVADTRIRRALGHFGMQRRLFGGSCICGGLCLRIGALLQLSGLRSGRLFGLLQ